MSAAVRFTGGENGVHVHGCEQPVAGARFVTLGFLGFFKFAHMRRSWTEVPSLPRRFTCMTWRALARALPARLRACCTRCHREARYASVAATLFGSSAASRKRVSTHVFRVCRGLKRRLHVCATTGRCFGRRVAEGQQRVLSGLPFPFSFPFPCPFPWTLVCLAV